MLRCCVAPLGQDPTASCIPAATQATSPGRGSPVLGTRSPGTACTCPAPPAGGQGCPGKRPLLQAAPRVRGCGQGEGREEAVGARPGGRSWGPVLLHPEHGARQNFTSEPQAPRLHNGEAVDCRRVGDCSLGLDTPQRNAPETHVVTVTSQQTSWTVRRGRGWTHRDGQDTVAANRSSGRPPRGSPCPGAQRAGLPVGRRTAGRPGCGRGQGGCGRRRVV